MSQKKKLVIFGPVDGDHLNRWLPSFVRTYDIHVLTLHPVEQAVAGVTYEALPRPTGKRWDFFLCIPHLRRRLRELKPDLLHVHYLSSYGIATSFSGAKCPTVLTVWGTDVNQGLRTPVIAYFCRRALKYFSFINSPSKNLAKILVDNGFPADRIGVFQYGVTTQNLPKRHLLPEKKHYDLVSMRDWAPLYRIETIIQLFTNYARKHSDVTLHLLGRSSAEQNERITQLVRQSPAADRIRIHGFIGRDEMLELLRQMDIMISIPTMDGMPLSLLESNCMGHWPILSRIPANVEWSGEGANYLDPLDDATFEKCMEDAKLRSRQSEHWQPLREKVLAEGDYDKNMDRLGQVYKKLLENPR